MLLEVHMVIVLVEAKLEGSMGGALELAMENYFLL